MYLFAVVRKVFFPSPLQCWTKKAYEDIFILLKFVLKSGPHSFVYNFWPIYWQCIWMQWHIKLESLFSNKRSFWKKMQNNRLHLAVGKFLCRVKKKNKTSLEMLLKIVQTCWTTGSRSLCEFNHLNFVIKF